MNADFRTQQQTFSDYLRDPERHPAPADVKPERMAMYRELFFNNIDGFLSCNFPVLRKLFSGEEWYALAQDFYARHTCSTPYFSEIAEEFLDYLQNERDNPRDPPFMLELAHYEWVEMAVSIAKEDVAEKPSFSGDWPAAKLRLSPLAWPLAYRFPVHRITPDFQPAEAPELPTFLIVYRDFSDEVHFLETTPVTYQLLALMQERPGLPAEAYLQSLAEQLQHPQPEILRARGIETVQDLARQHVILVNNQE